MLIFAFKSETGVYYIIQKVVLKKIEHIFIISRLNYKLKYLALFILYLFVIIHASNSISKIGKNFMCLLFSLNEHENAFSSKYKV